MALLTDSSGAILTDGGDDPIQDRYDSHQYYRIVAIIQRPGSQTKRLELEAIKRPVGL